MSTKRIYYHTTLAVEDHLCFNSSCCFSAADDHYPNNTFLNIYPTNLRYVWEYAHFMDSMCNKFHRKRLYKFYCEFHGNPFKIMDTVCSINSHTAIKCWGSHTGHIDDEPACPTTKNINYHSQRSNPKYWL